MRPVAYDIRGHPSGAFLFPKLTERRERNAYYKV